MRKAAETESGCTHFHYYIKHLFYISFHLGADLFNNIE